MSYHKATLSNDLFIHLAINQSTGLDTKESIKEPISESIREPISDSNKESDKKSKSKNNFSLDLEIDIALQGITSVFGPSGSGKTSLLRIIAGLDQHPHVELTVFNQVWQSKNIFLPTHKRPIGFVFQDANLFPHLNTIENLRYAYKRRWPTENSIDLTEIIDLLDLKTLLDSPSEQLSGGEKQRVSIARALLIQPRVLLMDEPLASLDAARKQEILTYLERMKDHFKLPIIYVTHSLNELTRLSDSVIVLEGGRVTQSGSLQSSLLNVNSPLTQNSEPCSVIDVRVKEIDEQWSLARVEFGSAELWIKNDHFKLEQKLRIRIQATDVSLSLSQAHDSSILNSLVMTIKTLSRRNNSATTLVALEQAEYGLLASITARSVKHLELQEGMTIWAQIKTAAVIN
jgi:molybdate transport system ATP-binding protein